MSQADEATETRREGYWNDFYAAAASTTRPLPSQFAAFVAGELREPHRVVDVGCGTGRDSIFFAANGHEVYGLDGSEQAVKACSELAEALDESATFQVAAIDDETAASRVPASDRPTVVYARFFLHAITEEEEQHFLALAAALTSPGDLLAVEYRTVRDSIGEKETGAHYRRYVNPASFQANAVNHGFDVTYAVEGFGFAKYRRDDAYVARSLLTKR